MTPAPLDKRAAAAYFGFRTVGAFDRARVRDKDREPDDRRIPLPDSHVEVGGMRSPQWNRSTLEDWQRVKHRTTVEPDDRWSEARATCSCGWTGGYWTLVSRASADAEQHVREMIDGK